MISTIFFLVGTFLGLLNKLIGTDEYRKYRSIFYIFGVIGFLLGLSIVFGNSSALVLGYICVIVSSVYLASVYWLLEWRSRPIKRDSPLINKKVIKFTKHASLDEIRLWGGDFDFFGKTLDEISKHEQYQNLEKKKFHKILFLCKKPRKTLTKKCYGKILNDFSNVEFRFYNDDRCTDLKVRGLIKKKNGGSQAPWVALIYNKLEEQDMVRLIEEDYSKHGTSIYIDAWDICWRNADQITSDEKQMCLDVFKDAKKIHE